MDILQDFIKSLAKEEIKSYKLYSKRTHNFETRKDIELFDSIKKNMDESDSFHNKLIYKKTKPDTKYYRLKNKITDDLGVILTNLNHRKPEIDVLHLLALAKIFNQKKQFSLMLHYLKLAERKAIDKEDYALLEAVYEQQVRLSMYNTDITPSEIIPKRNENNQRLNLLKDLENNLALLSYEVKTTQNLSPKKTVTEWLNQTLKNTLQLSYVKNSPNLRIKIFQNLSRLMLLLKDYVSLEKYLKTCLIEFEEDKLFTKQTHDVKIQLLVYLCNASFLLQKYKQSLDYSKLLQESLLEYNKAQYNQYIFYYYSILVYNYSETNLDKAIETLLEAQQQPVIKNNPSHYFYVLSNLTIFYFDSKKLRQANKLFTQIYVLEHYKMMDNAFKIKLQVFELVVKIELDDIDVAKKQLIQINKQIEELKEKDSLKYEISLLGILEQYLAQKTIKWRTLKTSIHQFIKLYADEESKSIFYNYTKWLTSKVSE